MTFIILFIVPRFTTLYAQFNSKLPAPTLALIAISHHFLPIHLIHGIPLPDPLSPVLWIILIFIAFRVFLYRTRDNPEVGARLDNIRFHMPLLGKLFHLTALFVWTTTLSGALVSGVRVTEGVRWRHEPPAVVG